MSHLVRSLVCAAFLAGLVSAAAQPPASACAERIGAPDGGFAAAVARNAPAVVSIFILRPRRDPMADVDGFDFFQSMAGLPLPDGSASGATQERSTSSGFAFSADGYILTSAHAVFDAREIRVVTADERRLRATLVGADRASDVAASRAASPPAWSAPIRAFCRAAAGCR